ncbi:dethiobiotin synthase [Zymobacter sp. IVIA_12111.31 C1]|uniref:dethiobiotin synthase n=1 Tax=Zymobacter sp. IVIA_12111.31 C1 TaxID=3394854 RepID=UPI0039C4C6F6
MSSFAFFVTGTDTEVGKTAVSCALLYKAHQQGLTTAASKPVACGTEMTAEGPRNEDAVALHQQCHPSLTLEEINPVLFDAPTSPHIAAAEAGATLSVERMLPPIREILTLRRQFTLVEGAGGWYVPINDHEDLSDVAIALDLPLILVVGIKLGALNHAFLTYEALKSSGLPIAGWVANSVTPPPSEHCLDQYLDILHHRLEAPCLGIVPFMENPQPEAIAQHLDLTPLLDD